MIDSSKRILVIGAGYLGCRVREYFEKRGYECYLGDIDPLKCSGGVPGVDLSDKASVSLLSGQFRESPPSAVILCASAKGGGVEACEKVYLKGCRNVCESFGKSRVVFCSSTVLYGVSNGDWVTEETVAKPLCGEFEILAKAEREVLASGGVVARLSAIYGPGRCVLLKKLQEENIRLSDDGARWLNYIHVDDAVSALFLLAAHRAAQREKVNVSDGHPMQAGTIYQYLCRLLKIDFLSCKTALRTNRRGKTNQRVSSSKLASLGWVPEYPSFFDGIRSLLNQSDQ